MNLKWNNIFIVISFCLMLNLSAQTTHQIFVKDFGAKGDGIGLDTKAIQKAVDKCSEVGGTVIFSPGKYLTGSIELKDNVDIYLANGSVILGSPDIKDYFERTPEIKSYNDLFLKHSLFYAEKIKNISIRGQGVIDGQGSFFKVTTKIKPDRYKNRPFIFRFVECSNIHVEDITMQNSAMWMQQYLACSDLTIRGIKVLNHANQNNDMMDIDGCKNVIISDCIGDTDDDGIVLKSTSPNITENIVITNCIVSSHCNAIKMGTESTGGFKNVSISNMIVKPSKVETTIFGFPYGTSGITLATVDGGILDGVTISNIIIDGPQVPIFLRLGNRARKYSADAPLPGVGIFRNVQITGVVATNVKSVGCSITGIPDHYIENVTLDDIRIVYSGGVKKEDYKTDVAELIDSYPEGNMWGRLPAYGFYLRHAKGIKLNNIDISFAENDERPAVVMDDVAEIKLNEINAQINKDARFFIGLNKGNDIIVCHSRSYGATQSFISVHDSESKNIYLEGNNMRNYVTPILQIIEGQVKSFQNIDSK